MAESGSRKKITIHTDGGCDGNPGPGGRVALLRGRAFHGFGILRQFCLRPLFVRTLLLCRWPLGTASNKRKGANPRDDTWNVATHTRILLAHIRPRGGDLPAAMP